ncbi:MAG: hypothetical protein CVU50_09285 [Candidatus Cloacimonetes bacterium HGW-Cloacimonetes-3]|jgi:uncharacterized membrane protein|nr:MAG: hypothetical protein CVU50_09285 [Candidatus Cloacimonetes bacterium HGW-Cloacimonetes-3]
MTNEVIKHNLFYKALMIAMKMPGVVVKRDDFLYNQLSKRLTLSTLRVIVKDPVEVRKVDLNLRIKLARSSIKLHTLKVSLISFGLGLPGLPYAPGTIPADLAQYYFHVLVIIQKLAYLMGWPDFEIDQDNLDDETMSRLIVFIGVMFGSHQAETAVKLLSKKLADELARRLPKLALTKFGFYNLAKQIAKWIGIKLTKEGFGKLVGKAVPIVGGFFAGGLTIATYHPMSKKFLRYLSNLDIASYKEISSQS